MQKTKALQVTFLGTGASPGIPVLGSDDPVSLSQDKKDKRLRTSAMVECDGHRIVIDCGPDFRQQLLTHQVSHVDSILFTHEHTDHVIGFDEIRPLGFKQNGISIHAGRKVIDALEARFSYLFDTEDRYIGAPVIEVNEVTPHPFKIGSVEIIPIRVFHGKLPIFGYRIGDFTYITDAKTVHPEDLVKLKNTKILVVNAIRHQPHYAHFNLEEALKFINFINPEQAYLTHISHHLGLHEEVQKTLPKNVFLAYDNLKLKL